MAAQVLAESSGYLKLEAQKYRGSSWKNAISGAKERFVKRSTTGYGEMILENSNTYYLTELEIGSEGESVAVLVDTGSSDLWVIEKGSCSASTSESEGGYSEFSAGDYTFSEEYYTFTESDYTITEGDPMGAVSPKTMKRVSPKLIHRRYGGGASNVPTLHTRKFKRDGSDGGDSGQEGYFGSESTYTEDSLIPDYGGTATSSSSSSTSTSACSGNVTFDEDGSDTFISNGTTFSIEYADGTYSKGTYGRDTVKFNGVSVHNLSFAVCDDTTSDTGVLGIGLVGLEATYLGSSSNDDSGSGSEPTETETEGVFADGASATSSASTSSSSYTYENLPAKLKSAGITKSNSYSIYLNDSDSDVASILFGAVDHDKYTGDLYVFPIVNTIASYGYDNPIEMDITLNKVSLADSKNSSEVELADGSAYALLDTGTTLTYFPEAILESLIGQLSVSYNSEIGYYMNCTDGEDLSLAFDFQGVKLNIAMSNFLIELVNSDYKKTGYCMVGIEANSESYFILGDSFLRSVYYVADIDNYQIALALANLDSTSEDIDVISKSIPSATSAPDYSSTWATSSTMTTAESTGSYSATTTNSDSSETGKGSSGSDSGSDSSSTSSGDSSTGSSSSKGGTNMLEASLWAFLPGLLAPLIM